MTVKKDTEKIPTSTLFLTFSTRDLPKEITVGYLEVKVALFVPNPMRCFNCNKFGHMSQRCKVAAKCPGCGKYIYIYFYVYFLFFFWGGGGGRGVCMHTGAVIEFCS